jgi:mRNA-degrading endonuclease toxin of MazEF toxin-antitoxin module
MSQEEDDKHRASLLAMGENGIRHLLATAGLTGRRRVIAYQLLDEFDAKRDGATSALNTRAVQAAETQALEAKKAREIAGWSLLVSVIALIVAGLALVNDWRKPETATR